MRRLRRLLCWLTSHDYWMVEGDRGVFECRHCGDRTTFGAHP